MIICTKQSIWRPFDRFYHVIAFSQLHHSVQLVLQLTVRHEAWVFVCVCVCECVLNDFNLCAHTNGDHWPVLGQKAAHRYSAASIEPAIVDEFTIENYPPISSAACVHAWCDSKTPGDIPSEYIHTATEAEWPHYCRLQYAIISHGVTFYFDISIENTFSLICYHIAHCEPVDCRKPQKGICWLKKKNHCASIRCRTFCFLFCPFRVTNHANVQLRVVGFRVNDYLFQ